MDTVTQAVLGAAIARLAVGKNMPRKALFWGAVVATLPDLDVFIPHDDDLDNFTLHRSWSHSWLIQSLVAPFLALFCYKTIANSFSYKSWLLLIWLALITHSGLDALTVYGTQILWPINQPPVSNGSIFIIDPIYTLPLLCGVIVVAVYPNSLYFYYWLRCGFLLSCCYLAWGLAAQYNIYQQAQSALSQQNIKAEKIRVIATPFNTLLWRILVMDEDNYYEGFRSIFDDTDSIDFNQYPRHKQLKNRLSNDKPIKQLDWFTNGFYALKQTDEYIIMSDLRMGVEPYYVFSFSLAEKKDQNWVSLAKPQHFAVDRPSARLLSEIWQRIWQQ